MTVEELQILLEVNYDKIKPALDKARQIVDNFVSGGKEQLIIEATDNGSFSRLKGDIKGLTAEQQLLINKIDTLKQEIALMPGWNFSDRQILEARAELEKLENQLKKTQNQANNVDFSKNFEKGIKGVKKFALALFSVRSAWAVVSKATSSYLSTNEELSNKLQSVWIGLGSFLAPVLEQIANIFIKLIGYINVFVKALTGIDFLAKSNANALNKQAKAQKKLNSQTSGIDEINSIQSDNSEGSVASAGGNVEFPELDPNTIKAIENFASKVKELWPILSKLAIVLGLVAVAFWLVNSPVLLTVLAIGAIIAIVALLILNWDKLKEKTAEVFSNMIEWVKSIPEFFSNMVNKIVEFLSMLPDWFRENFGIVGEIIAQSIENILTLFRNLFSGIKRIFGGIKDFIVGIFTGDLTKAFKGLANVFSGVINSILSIFQSALNFLLTPINALIAGFNETIGKVPRVPNIPQLKISIPKIPKLLTGTDFVKSAGLAWLDPGEAVVTKENNSKYDGIASAQSEASSLNMSEIMTILTRIESSINNIDANTYLDSSQLAKSMYKPLENERKRRNVNGVLT